MNIGNLPITVFKSTRLFGILDYLEFAASPDRVSYCSKINLLIHRVKFAIKDVSPVFYRPFPDIFVFIGTLIISYWKGIQMKYFTK